MRQPTNFGRPLWGTNLFGGGEFAAEVLSSDLVVFDGFSLSDGDSLSVRRIINPGPVREINKTSVPRGDGEFLNGVFYRNREITVIGRVRAPTGADFNQLLDTVKAGLRTEEGDLDIIEEGLDPRRYVGTLSNFDGMLAERDYYHVTWLPFEAKFYCKPFGHDRAYTSQTNAITSSPAPDAVMNQGTVEAKPVFVFIFSSATTVTTVNLKRLDMEGNVLDEIEYVGTIAASDVLVFDSENQQVTKNGVDVDYSGAFPLLDVGQNLFEYTIDGTFAATVTPKYKRTWL